MLVPVMVPDLGGGDEPLSISALFVEPGDRVEQGDSIVEVLLSGVACDVPAPIAGRVVQIACTLDSSVKSGDTIVWIESSQAGPVAGPCDLPDRPQ